MGRLVHRFQAEGSSPFVQEPQGRNHPSGVGGNEGAGAASHLRPRSRITEGVDGEARHVPFAPVDGREEERRAGLANRRGQPEVDVIVVNVGPRASHEHGAVVESPNRGAVHVALEPLGGTPPIRHSAGNGVEAGDEDYHLHGQWGTHVFGAQYRGSRPHLEGGAPRDVHEESGHPSGMDPRGNRPLTFARFPSTSRFLDQELGLNGLHP